MSESHDHSAAVETRSTIDGDKNAYKRFHRLRVFLVGAVPLGMLYAITALAYRHDQSPCGCGRT